ncbi:MAG: helix-hairpin-helix domain-containing protein [Candidatus Azobacteroides sp.]|nr:helix-hairpin-helix domain-containing protein [Candidatus Azobacteroides sp.]
MKKIIFYFWTLVLWGWAPNLFSQIDRNNSEWMDYLEDLSDKDEASEEYIENLFDDLSDIIDNPYDLQHVSKEELEKLPFLTDLQIESLLYYIYKFGPLTDIYELKNVDELDMQTIVYLLPFVYVGKMEENVSPETRFPLRGKHTFVLRDNFCLQKKSGYAQSTEEERRDHPNKYYWGDPHSLYFRYEWNGSDRIQLGITGEKDAGEPFLKAYDKKGFDFYTANLTFRKLGILEELQLGHYRLSFGQGLVMNTNFSMGKTPDAVNIGLKNQGIKRHLSTNESQYFSGAAGTFRWKNVRFSLFYSYRNSDANANDSLIYTFKTDGYHRTFNDLLKKQTVQVELFGGNIQWTENNFSAGLTAVRYSFGGKMLNPDPRPYNLFYLRGKENLNAGIYYHYRRKKWIFQGETALDQMGKMASLNHLFFQPASFVEGVFSVRHYDRQYNALYGNAFSESTAVQNETGVYTGIRMHFSRRWELSAYWDCFAFFWLKYGVNAPSSGNDVSMQLKYFCNTKVQMNLRYKYKEKYKNVNSDEKKVTEIWPYEQHRWRYQIQYLPSNTFTFKTQADYNIYRSSEENQQAWSLTQSFSCLPAKSKWQIDGGLAYFHTGNWNTKISVYEKNVLYTFGYSMYYGEGLRYYLLVKWKINKPLSIYLKCGSTHYLDRNAIGSGLEEITGKEKTDIYCLIKYNF